MRWRTSGYPSSFSPRFFENDPTHPSRGISLWVKRKFVLFLPHFLCSQLIAQASRRMNRSYYIRLRRRRRRLLLLFLFLLLRAKDKERRGKNRSVDILVSASKSTDAVRAIVSLRFLLGDAHLRQHADSLLTDVALWSTIDIIWWPWIAVGICRVWNVSTVECHLNKNERVLQDTEKYSVKKIISSRTSNWFTLTSTSQLLSLDDTVLAFVPDVMRRFDKTKSFFGLNNSYFTWIALHAWRVILSFIQVNILRRTPKHDHWDLCFSSLRWWIRLEGWFDLCRHHFFEQQQQVPPYDPHLSTRMLDIGMENHSLLIHRLFQPVSSTIQDTTPLRSPHWFHRHHRQTQVRLREQSNHETDTKAERTVPAAATAAAAARWNDVIIGSFSSPFTFIIDDGYVIALLSWAGKSGLSLTKKRTWSLWSTAIGTEMRTSPGNTIDN